MPIVSSTRVVGPAQPDGRKYVAEAHTDHLGTVRNVEYLAAVGADYDAILAARATYIESYLADEEAARLASDGA